MRVNSPITAFFPRILAVVLMFVILFITSSFKTGSDDLQVKQVNLIIRQIGHQLLLQAGDSTSRVLPVKEINEGTFRLEFEKELIFNHDSLMVMTRNLLPEKQFPGGYMVTVHDCMQRVIVYGFQVNNSSPDILACSGRSEPVGCYSVEFTFPDLYRRDPAPISEDISKKINSKPERPSLASDNDIDQLTEQLKAFEARAQEGNLKREEYKTTPVEYSLAKLVYSGVLVLLVVTLVIARFGNSSKTTPRQNQDSITIGKFLFDVKGQRLVCGTEVISLTDKECQILELFNKSFGALISRETLMEKVWIDEGVITGRSLDMFVSKLRKKLSSDPKLRITNVHGKGYRLEHQ
jgi:DNA-binding response OmpR family regulator